MHARVFSVFSVVGVDRAHTGTQRKRARVGFASSSSSRAHSPHRAGHVDDAAMTTRTLSARLPPLSTLEGVLFDLDGTLCDSDPVHFEVFDDMFTAHGVCAPTGLTHDFFTAHIAGRANVDIFTEAFYPNLTPAEREALAEDKERAFREKLLSRELPKANGLDALLRTLDMSGVKTCVVTNAPRANAEAMLARLGLREYFGEDRLVIGSECARAKPNPDPYLEGLKRIGLTSSEKCVAFEDSPAGARAAVAANIPVVGILSSQNAEALMSAGCALCVKDFAAPELFDAFGAAVPE